MSDVALDPFSHRRDGLLKKLYDHDETVDVLIKQALIQAQMGCDVIAPSDMMDSELEKLESFSCQYKMFKFFHMQLSMLLTFMVLSEMLLDQKNL